MAVYHQLSKPWLWFYTRFANSPRDGLRILTFHDIPEQERTAFETLLDFIMESYQILPPADVEKLVTESPTRGSRRPGCLLTFDDGYASNSEVARTILARRGIKAVFFVCPQLMELPSPDQNAAIAHHVYEGRNVPSHMRFMSWADVEYLLSQGHTVGSHTATHKRLSELSNSQREAQIFESAEVLQRRTGVDPLWFAYPFGNIESIDARSYATIRHRHRFCCTGIRGLNTFPLSPLTLFRDAVDLSAPFEYQQLSLCGGLDFLYTRAAAQVRAYAQAS